MERRGGKEGPKGPKHSIRGASSQGGTSGGSMELSELLGVDVATLSKPVSGVTLGSNGSDGAPSSGKEGSTQHQQMVDILQAQRDRYKDRLAVVRTFTTCQSHVYSCLCFCCLTRTITPQQAETVAITVQQRLDVAEGCKTQLEQDNIALYSKIRYLQSIAGTGPQSTGKGQVRHILLVIAFTSSYVIGWTMTSSEFFILFLIYGFYHASYSVDVRSQCAFAITLDMTKSPTMDLLPRTGERAERSSFLCYVVLFYVAEAASDQSPDISPYYMHLQPLLRFWVIFDAHHDFSRRSGGRGGYRNGESMEESRESGTADRDRDREVEGRYGVLYEQRMNPFAEVITQ